MFTSTHDVEAQRTSVWARPKPRNSSVGARRGLCGVGGSRALDVSRVCRAGRATSIQSSTQGLSDGQIGVVGLEKLVSDRSISADHVVAKALDEGTDLGPGHLGDEGATAPNEPAGYARHKHLRPTQSGNLCEQRKQFGVGQHVIATHVEVCVQRIGPQGANDEVHDILDRNWLDPVWNPPR